MIPTVLMTAIGIILVASGGSKSAAIVSGILVLAFCATALTGYTLGTIFVTRGASLATVQNEFLSSVSHELRTPLTSIRLFIDTLREARIEDPAEKQRCLTIVNQELIRLDALVGKLIELSKIESRDAAFDRRPVPVEGIIADAVAAFDVIRFSSDVDLQVRVAQDLMVVGDRAALAQAVGNLLTNAWKYTRPAGKKIEIDADGDPKHVTITVTDNGLGIARLEQETVFHKFQRGTAAVESGTLGTGLGLAIVRAIVEAHQGKVELRSEVERGTRVRLILPRMTSVAA
jgi:two-component system phosphate regulon sensor histidine kinase PhoR